MTGERIAVVAALVALVLAACEPGRSEGVVGALPAAPVIRANQASWPPPGFSIVQDFPAVGEVLVDGNLLIVPTGHGLTAVDLTANRQLWSVPTPGWARAVVALGDGHYWVADSTAGVTSVRAPSDDVRSVAVGTVTDIGATPDGALVTVSEGLLIALTADSNGMPRETSRLVLDGRPIDLDVTVSQSGPHWAVALRGAGLAVGHQRGADLVLDRSDPRVGRTERAALEPSGAVLTIGRRGTVRRIADGGVEEGRLPLTQHRAVAVASDGEPWFACGQAGVFRGLPSTDEAVAIHTRDGEAAVAVSSDPDGSGVYVSWWDGLVERLDRDGLVLGAWTLGSAYRAVDVTPEVIALRHASNRSAILAMGSALTESALFSRTEKLAGLSWDGARTWVAWNAAGGFLVDSGSDGLEIERVVDSDVTAFAAADDGSTWFTGAEIGWGRLDSGTMVTEALGEPEQDVRLVAVSDGWFVSGTHYHRDFLAFPLDRPGHRVRAWLPGVALAVGVKDGHALVVARRSTVLTVPLEQGPTPPTTTLQLYPPAESYEWREAQGLCQVGDAILVPMGEAGLARLSMGDSGELSLEAVLETPGRARRCVAVSGNEVLVADETAVIRLQVD